MKIVHVYAQNLKIFSQALDGTGCRINGSRKLDYMYKTLSKFNTRDVMGLVVFRSPMTKKTLKYIQAFDEFFMFTPQPIIVISDQITDLYRAGKIKVKYSKLFLVDSIDNTISDIDIKRIFATLSCMSGDMYDLSEIEAFRAAESEKVRAREAENKQLLADEVLSSLAE